MDFGLAYRSCLSMLKTIFSFFLIISVVYIISILIGQLILFGDDARCFNVICSKG